MAFELLAKIPESQREETWQAARERVVARKDQYVQSVLAKTIDEAERASKQGEFAEAFNLLKTTPKPQREATWQAAWGRVVKGRDHSEEIRCRYQEAMTEIESVFDWREVALPQDDERSGHGTVSLKRLVRHQPVSSWVKKLLAFQHPLFKQEAEQLRQAVQKVRDDLAVLNAQLTKNFAEAHRASEQGEFDKAVELLEEVPKSLRSEKWRKDWDRAVDGRGLRAKKIRLLTEGLERRKWAQAGGTPRLLRQLVRQYLKICPEDEEMQELADKLREHFKRNVELFVMGAFIFLALGFFIFIGFLIVLN